MRTGDDALFWLREYFSKKEGYVPMLSYYGPNVPSNNIRVEGPEFFRLSFCSSWRAPQLSCSLTPATFAIICDLDEELVTLPLDTPS